ncbi:hypothetical protein QVD17_09110 [Tagetes erecta]|uniref:Uncharacterized protein n=1 Tax=Tagetes erecta TaxID=13708 RepID=A0AAD8L3Z9_TARER|nr:hypothetical protein QVD17_09110 [Tagetes erecta]
MVALEEVRESQTTGAEVLVVDDSNDASANYKSAISDLENAKWLEAKNDDMQSMHDNQAADLVELPTTLGP